MSHICRFHSCAILCILLPTAEAEPQQWFPELRGSHVRLTAEWQNSPIVAVGEVVNVRRYGTKTYSGLSYPAPPGAHEVYWCVGDFRATAVVKGSLDAAPQSYLFTSDPDCREIYGSVRGKNPKTRVWFLRIERGFLRPVYDYGTYRYFALLGRWDEDPRLRPRQRLGALLLTPRANTTTLKDYAVYLWDVGDIACDLLGKAECVIRIRRLEKLGNPALQQMAYTYLQDQLHVGC